MHVRAVTYQGKNSVAVKKVEAPSIQDREVENGAGPGKRIHAKALSKSDKR